MQREKFIRLIADTIMKVNRPGDARTEAEQIANAIEHRFIVIDPNEPESHAGDYRGQPVYRCPHVFEKDGKCEVCSTPLQQ
jgi:hypothetical protein